MSYRDSKLTFLLRDAIGGNSKTIVIATVSPNEKWFHETLSTLQFVQRAKYIKCAAEITEDANTLIKKLKDEVKELRLQLDSTHIHIVQSCPSESNQEEYSPSNTKNEDNSIETSLGLLALCICVGVWIAKKIRKTR